MEAVDLVTPLSLEKYTYNDMGTYMSFKWNERNKRYYSTLRNGFSGVDNLHLGSIWRVCTGGFNIAAECGKLVIDDIIRRDNN